jgi:DNA invertase Pin-like site-specific DNA recombinase
MQALLGELTHVQPTYLLCRALDRLHRSSLEWELMHHRLVEAGVQAVVQFPSLEGAPLVTRLAETQDQAFASIQAVFAQLQKADQKQKLMAGRRERAAQGLPNGGHAPYGLRRVERGAPFVVHEEEARTYRQLIEWAIEGRGSAWMAHRLNRLGVPTRRARSGWTATTVRKILASEAQMGMIRVRFGGTNAWQPAKDQPVLVPRERWEEAQAVLRGRQRQGGSNQKRHVLAGLLRCSACGATLKASVNRPLRAGKRYEYWHYTCKVYNSGCSEGYSISERRALSELVEHVNERLHSTKEWVRAEVATSVGEVEERIGELSKDLADAERKVRRAHAAWVDADEDMATIALDELHKRRESARQLQGELDDARQGYAELMTRPSQQIDMEKLRELLMGWEEFPDDAKREVLETSSTMPRSCQRAATDACEYVGAMIPQTIRAISHRGARTSDVDTRPGQCRVRAAADRGLSEGMAPTGSGKPSWTESEGSPSRMS